MNNKNKIIVVLIIILITFFTQNTFAKFYEKLEKTLIKAEIAEPIAIFESVSETVKINNFNKYSGEKEYIFKIKNYDILENGERRISEVNFNYFIEIKSTNSNFPIKYKLIDMQNNEEIELINNKSNEISMKSEKEFEKGYKLVIMYDETKKVDTNEKSADIEILVKISQSMQLKFVSKNLFILRNFEIRNLENQILERNNNIKNIKILKTTLIFLLIILYSSITNYAKYNYSYKVTAFSLKIPDSQILYEINMSNNGIGYTNQNVEIMISFNKEINSVDGFSLSADRKKLSRIVEENEKNTIKVIDDYGNSQIITYVVNNIDKIIPEILGVENGVTYTDNVEIKYKDNVGIQKIEVFKILENNEAVIEKNPYKIENSGTYRIIVSDLAGNINEKIIKIEKNYIIEYK